MYLFVSPMEGGEKIRAEAVFTLPPRRRGGECDGVTQNDLVDAGAANPITDGGLAFTKQ